MDEAHQVLCFRNGVLHRHNFLHSRFRAYLFGVAIGLLYRVSAMEGMKHDSQGSGVTWACISMPAACASNASRAPGVLHTLEALRRFHDLGTPCA